MSTIKNAAKQLKDPSGKSWIHFLKNYYMYILLFITIVILSVVKLGDVRMFARGHFLNWESSIVNLLRNASPILTLVGGFTLIIIAGQIDLSVGSALTLNAVLYSILVLNGIGFAGSMIIILIFGMFLGFINGFLIAKLRITPVIATLVTLSFYKGIARLLVPPGLSGIKSTDTLSMPDWINNYGREGVIAGLPIAFFVAVIVIIILAIVKRKTIIGKHTVAIGGNMEAAELSGVNVVKIIWILYIITGVLGALAGIARASYMSMGDPLTGDGMEFDCLIAALLGGTNIWGGEGSVIKAVIGAMIIVCINTGLMTVMPPFWLMFIKGAVLVGSVALYNIIQAKASTA
jgi:ribose/xylose/arabinose/galactoside ABC-type transport system permease subunit